MYCLTSQIRNAAISVPSNIAEGSARNSPRELFQFLGIAMGSVAELETQLELALRLHYLPAGAEPLVRVRSVGRLLAALRNTFKNRTQSRAQRAKVST